MILIDGLTDWIDKWAAINWHRYH